MLYGMTSVDHFVQELKRHEIHWIATLCGHGLNPLFHAARQVGIRLVDTRNEQTASYIADYYGKLTGRPGVCAVSSGVAHINALTGVANAWFDHSPMLLISGAAALRTSGLGHFQDMDQVTIASPITKFSRVIDVPERSAQILDQALRIATTPPHGPVHLTYPMDIQEAEVPRKKLMPVSSKGVDTHLPAFENLETELADAKRPLIVLGSGAFYEEVGAAVRVFTEEHAIPVVVPIWDRGVVNIPWDTYCGVVGAATGGAGLLAEADLLILIGVEDDYRVNYLQQPRQAVVRMNRGVGVLSGMDAPVYTSWLTLARAKARQHREQVVENGRKQARKGLHAIHIIDALEETMSDDTLLLIDGGSIGQWAHQTLCNTRYPSDWLTCGRSGVVGWGIGGAMAARLAYPENPIVLLSGDGAFTFNLADIECAVRQNLPFVAVVADDQAWGITKEGHVAEFGEAISSTLGPVAFDLVAASMGAIGRRVTSADGIRAELREALDSGKVTVLHVPIIGGNP